MSASKDDDASDQVVYFDENTVAGLLNSLRGYTRFLLTDEADVVLKKMGYTLPPPGAREWATNDCRSQLLTLYDRPHNFTRRLKHESIKVVDAKLNVLVSRRKLFANFNSVFHRVQYQVISLLLHCCVKHQVPWQMPCWNEQSFGHSTVR